MAVSNKKVFRWSGIFIILLGLIFIASGGGLSYSSYKFARTAVSTSGVVTHVEVNWSSNSSSSGGSPSPTYKPTISFFDKSGLPQSAQTYLSSSAYDYPIGTKLRILYTPEDPSHMRLDHWFALWGFGLIFLGVGIIMFIGGVAFLKVSKKVKDQPDAPDEAKKTTQYSYSSAEEPEKSRSTIRRK